MTPLYNHHVVAKVRTIGAIGSFQQKRFDFMLDSADMPERKNKEAIRILNQIGYETHGVTVEERR